VEDLVQPGDGPQFYHVAGDNQFQYGSMGALGGQRHGAVVSRSDGQITYRDWNPDRRRPRRAVITSSRPVNPQIVYGGKHGGDPLPIRFEDLDKCRTCRRRGPTRNEVQQTVSWTTSIDSRSSRPACRVQVVAVSDEDPPTAASRGKLSVRTSPCGPRKAEGAQGGLNNRPSTVCRGPRIGGH